MYCGVAPIKIPGRDTEFAPHYSNKNHSFIGGRFICDCPGCVPCAAASAAQCRSYLEESVFEGMEKAGLTGDMVTLTLSHKFNSDWKESRKGLSKAFTSLHKALNKFFKKMGVVGYFKTLEAPVGSNGLHPHYHILFARPKHWTELDEKTFSDKLRIQWYRSVKQHGFECNEHGFDYKPNCVNDYIAKFDTSFDLELHLEEKATKEHRTKFELAAHDTKIARRSGRTFVQLLQAAMLGDDHAGDLYVRWTQAMHKSVRFDSRSLAKALGIPTLEQWKKQMKHKTETPEQEFEKTPEDEKLKLDVPQYIVNTLANSPVRDYYPAVLDYGKRLCRDLTPENKAQKLKQWQTLFDRCMADHKKHMAMIPHLNMNADQIRHLMMMSFTRPLTPKEIAAYNVARIYYYRKPAQVQKLRRLLRHRGTM
jgi:hypothetical protein